MLGRVLRVRQRLLGVLLRSKRTLHTTALAPRRLLPTASTASKLATPALSSPTLAAGLHTSRTGLQAAVTTAGDVASDAPRIDTGSGSAHTGSGKPVATVPRRSPAELEQLELIKREFLASEAKHRSGEQLDDLGARFAVPASERVFANSDTPLAHVAAYGFDYDYTLAQYKTGLKDMIYDLAQQHLIEKRGYPKEIGARRFDRHFAIRGLHYDKRTGFLLKLDQFGKITPENVMKGRTHVPQKVIVDQYGGLRLTSDYIKSNLNMLYDTFCLPEACLLADVAQTFMDRKVDFSPQYLWTDVRETIEQLHSGGLIHNTIASRPHDFIHKNENLWRLLDRLKRANKKLFLLTNSPFGFVDAGMRYLLDERHLRERAYTSWRELFDVVIVKAKKPYFFERTGRFRKLDVATGNLSLESVDRFRPMEVYTEGSLQEFTHLTGLTGHSVLYAGDHIFSDLVGPSSTAMWKTAAIIKEIAYETQKMATPEFSSNLQALLSTERLIRFGQRIDLTDAGDATARHLLEQLKVQRNAYRRELKTMFNESFGSVFRTTSHRTNFYAELGRCADVYTSSIDNFLHYPSDYCFYVQREYFPHEHAPRHSPGIQPATSIAPPSDT